MKTSLLNQLSEEITQGEWCINKKLKAFVEVAKDGQGMTMIADCTDCDDDRPRSEDEANARAIALVPELLAEVIKLREVVTALVKADTAICENIGTKSDQAMNRIAALDMANEAIAKATVS